MAVEDARQGQPRRKGKAQAPAGAGKATTPPGKGDGLEKARRKLGPGVLDGLLAIAAENDEKAREERRHQAGK